MKYYIIVIGALTLGVPGSTLAAAPIVQQQDQHAQRAVTRWDDQLVRILRLGGR